MTAGSRYSDQERREAVVCYVLHGNWKRVSELTGIPERTLNDWSAQPWFATMLAEVRAEKGAELDGAYTRILDEALQQLLDRLQHGDPYIAGGEVKRKPVSARDLALVAAITFDKRQASRDVPAPAKPIDHSKMWERMGELGRQMREDIEEQGRKQRQEIEEQDRLRGH